MSKGRTVTLTEREIAAFRSAFALFEAEHEADAYYGGLSLQNRNDLKALARINTKLAEAMRP